MFFRKLPEVAENQGDAIKKRKKAINQVVDNPFDELMNLNLMCALRQETLAAGVKWISLGASQVCLLTTCN